MTPDTPTPPAEQSRQQLLDALRVKIVEANPELQRVHQGCRITGRGYHNTEVLYVHENHPFMFSATVYKNGSGVLENIDFDKREMKISPREIRLADVLLALNNAATYPRIDWCLNGEIELVLPTFFVEREINAARWNLRQDSLDLQSTETLQFLADLLS